MSERSSSIEDGESIQLCELECDEEKIDCLDDDEEKRRIENQNIREIIKKVRDVDSEECFVVVAIL